MAFDVNSFTQSFAQWYGLGQQLGARYDINKMQQAQPEAQHFVANPSAGGAPGPHGGLGIDGYNYLGQKFDAMPDQQQMRLAQQQERQRIFERRGLFDDARFAGNNALAMKSSQIANRVAEMNAQEKKQILDANKLITKALDGDTAALSEVLKSGAKYVTADNTPMSVVLSEDGKSATFKAGQGAGVTKKLSDLTRGEIGAIVNRVRPGVLANASPQYAALAQSDQQAQERFGLANQQFKKQREDADRRFTEQVRQFNTTDQRQRENAAKQQKQWLKQNELAELRFDLAEESFQHNRAMDLAQMQKSHQLIDARIKKLQQKLGPAEWQYNWSVIRNPQTTPLEFAIATGIDLSELENPQVIQAIESYQMTLTKPPPLSSTLPNQQIRGLGTRTPVTPPQLGNPGYSNFGVEG